MAGPPGKDISGDRKGVVVVQMVVNINTKISIDIKGPGLFWLM
jgi:hypothetical protein